VYEHHAELISGLSNRVHRISQKPGDAARTKLVNNLLAAINLAGAAECMALAQRLGLSLETTLDVIEQSSGQSWIGSDRMRRAIAGDYAPRAHTTLLNKDSHLALAMAASVGFEATVGAASARLFKAACDSGLDSEDDASVFKHTLAQRLT
jgi:L-threonate 2-dehydrogenase